MTEEDEAEGKELFVPGEEQKSKSDDENLDHPTPEPVTLFEAQTTEQLLSENQESETYKEDPEESSKKSSEVLERPEPA